ncbi:holo-ACP synthase [Bacillus alkalicellulosilyticus]|uniref:holo-ACP synthase n=1 Tax=Alkalihalobacterium alkalicellulosilyticum TaxID=1912214 RepID=UPI00099718F1|nr:holo-ACP synthase [Bacillus alkalicellulosilyticus]
MILGIGVDIVELKRIETVANRNEKFYKRILTKSEQEKYVLLSPKRKIEFLAGRFAAKEAFVKAVGTGISKRYGWQDIQIIAEVSGKPKVVSDLVERVHLSISHSKEYAVAQVIIESLSS